MRIFRGLVRLCAALGVLLLVGSYLGALHPLGDALAVFRLWIAAGVLLCGLILLLSRDRGWAMYFVALSLVGSLTPASGYVGTPAFGSGVEQAGAGQSLYQKNLLYVARDPDAILADIEDLAPDFITLQEVSDANRAAIYDRLPDTYDRAICAFSGVGGVAIASRYEAVEGSVLCIARLGMVAMQVEGPEGRVWLVSVHLHWPWPLGQPEQAAQILPLIARMEGPVLIGGDFNMVHWSHLMAEFEQASGSRAVRQGQPTFELHWRGWPWLALEIDHVLVPPDAVGRGERLDFLGSDHRGVIAWFDL